MTRTYALQGDCGLGEDGLPIPSPELVPIARAIAGDRLLLSFSGRDSLAVWLYLREHGFELIPYWCYSVPGLSYEQQMLEYYERQMATHIIRLPHPYTYNMLTGGAYQPLENWRVLYWSGLPRFDYSDIDARLAKQFGLGDNYLCAVGIKAADNLMRLRLIRQMGPIGLKKRRYYYPIWDWKTADVQGCIRRHGVKLPREYRYWGSTGVGIEYEWLRYLRDNLPQDYQKVLDLFPLADLELFRYEKVG